MERELRSRSASCRTCVCSLCLTGLLILVGLLAPAAGRAEKPPRDVKERCCFQLSVQAGGTETSDFGDGTGSYPYFKGKYFVSWKFAFRVLLKEGHHRGHDHLVPIARNGFRAKSHPKVALHTWMAEWSFTDTPEAVQSACCFTQNPHGWEPACSSPNAALDSGGLSAEAKPVPTYQVIGGEFEAELADLPERASFQCGLEDGRLATMSPGLFDAIFPGPSSKQLTHGTDFSKTCSISVTLGPDGGIRFVGSSANVQMRTRFIYFPPSKLYRTAKRLDSLTGTEAPGFQGPPVEPNAGPGCR